jgi:hypothetical protein
MHLVSLDLQFVPDTCRTESSDNDATLQGSTTVHERRCTPFVCSGTPSPSRIKSI